VVAAQPPSFPAYKAVTASASLSSDGSRLFVMLFNKHHDRPASVTVRVSGFAAGTAKRWTVTGPRLESTNLGSEEVKETVSGESRVWGFALRESCRLSKP
jgi:alpha-L-arabinofuranosidase